MEKTARGSRRRIVLALFWLAGYLVATQDYMSYRERSEAWLALSVPLIYLAAQTPLWVARIFLRWRLETPRTNHGGSTYRPLSLAEIMIFTATVSLSFAAARLVSSGEEFIPYWPSMAIACAIAAGLGLATTLPILFLILGLRRLSLGTAILAAYAAISLIITVVVSCAFFRAQVDDLLFSLSPTLAGFVVAITVPLVIPRWFGYRLAWGREIA